MVAEDGPITIKIETVMPTAAQTLEENTTESLDKWEREILPSTEQGDGFIIGLPALPHDKKSNTDKEAGASCKGRKGTSLGSGKGNPQCRLYVSAQWEARRLVASDRWLM